MLSATHAIQRTHLHDEVLSKLRAMILRGDMAPGERVQERALCEQLGISRTPLREASARLHEAMLAHEAGATESLLRLDVNSSHEGRGSRQPHAGAVHEGLAIRVERARFIVSTDPERLRSHAGAEYLRPSSPVTRAVSPMRCTTTA